MIFFTEYPSKIGRLTLVSDEKSLTGLYIDGQKHLPSQLHNTAVRNDTLELFCEVKKWLDSYFSGKNPPTNTLPLDPCGTPFRKLIWSYLIEIPYGKTVTYGELAGRAAGELGKARMSAQAVGGAVGHNPISIIIPCHRVIGADGDLTGYDGGIDIKLKLLAHEGASSLGRTK